MSDPSRSKAIIALGKRLVSQIEDEGDLAAAWLSHLLAERLTAVEQASDPDAQAKAESACTALVLELWRNQATFPRRARPFEDFDPVLRTLESLAVDRGHFHYFPRALQQSAEQDALPEKALNWLRFAREVDDTARQLIRIGLGRAVAELGEEMGEWAELAREAAADEPPEVVIFRIVSEEADDFDVDRDRNQKRLDRLKAFIDLGQTLANDLASELDGTNNGRVGGTSPESEE